MAARYNTCTVMDTGTTVSDIASLALLYNTLGAQSEWTLAKRVLPSSSRTRYDVLVAAHQSVENGSRVLHI